MDDATVEASGDALRRRAKVRLRWLVAAHAALAVLPAASGYFLEMIPYLGGGYMVSQALEGLLLAQLTLLAFWAGLGRGRVVGRLVAAALGCVYLAIWPTIGSIFPIRSMGGGGPRFPGQGRLLEDFPQTLFHYAGAIGVFVALFATGFFIARRWLNELQWRPDAESGRRGGALRYAVSGSIVVTVCVALLFVSRYEMRSKNPFNTGGDAVYPCIAFPISTICVVWAALGSGRVCRRVLFAIVFAAIMAVAIRIGGQSVWIADYQAWFDLQTWFRFLGPSALKWDLVSLLPVAILMVTLLAVRACGYRLARRAATNRQFSLRELLAALTLACAGLAFVAVPAERQRRAVAALEAAGERVGYAADDQTLWWFWPADCLRNWLPRDYFDRVEDRLSLDGWEVTDALIAHLPALKGLEELGLCGTQITDEGLVHLSGMSRLKYLRLDDNYLGDAGLAHLRGLAQLEELSLSGTEITDAAIDHLRELPRLESLYLDSCQITDAGLLKLRELKSLKALSLGEAPITDAGMSHLRELTRLESLWLDRTPISDRGLAQLQSLANLKLLSLEGTRVGDAGLAQLNRLANLEELRLAGTKVTGAAFGRLRGLTRLQEVRVSATAFTDAGLAELCKLQSLNYIALDKTQITDAGLVYLHGLPNLAGLGLNDTAVGDEGLEHLEGLAMQAGLQLENTRVTDAGIRHLEKLTQLRMLSLKGAGVTQEGIARLRQALPYASISGP